uniref:Saposin B-type domain-containing protein n=1 Tax=Panagrellus redivivus TaxID=6233 RepID=A0A7E5A0L8_PANRE
MRKFVFFVAVFCLFGYGLTAPTTDFAKDDNKDSLSCIVCNAMVDMTRQNTGSTFNDVLDGMNSYCRLYFSNYVNNCKYIVQAHLYPVYCQARLTNLSWRTICDREKLCPTKNNNDAHPSPPPE